MPSKSWAVNLGWCHAVATATDLIAWLKLIGCDGDLAKAAPQTLRYRIFTAPARPRGQHLRWLRLPKSWPWARTLVTAISRIRALPIRPWITTQSHLPDDQEEPRRPRHRRESRRHHAPQP